MEKPTKPKSIFELPAARVGIIYSRVSSDEQAEENTSLSDQEDKAVAYAAANDIYVPPNFIFREDYTGKVLDRPELNKVRKILKEGRANCLIAHRPNRMDRSEYGVNYMTLLVELKNLGVELHYSKFGRKINLNDPTEALLQLIEGWKSGEDHRETVEKLRDGRYKKVELGSAMAHRRTPYGYEQVKEPVGKKGHRWVLKPFEPESRVVYLIFHWYVFGDETGLPLTPRFIAERLEKDKVPSRGDGDANLHKKAGQFQWSRSTIVSILGNETYAGKWHYRKSKKNHKVTADSIPVEVEPIIDPTLWKLAQERRAQAAKHSNRRRYDYLLSGRVACGCCGYAMEGQFNRYKRVGGGESITLYYSCPSRQKHYRRDCSLPYFRADKSEGVLWDYLTDLFTSDDSEKLRNGLLGYQKAQAEKVDPFMHDLRLVEAQIADLESELDELMEDYRLARGERHKARIALDIEMREKQLDASQARRREIKAELEDKTVTDEQFIAFEQFARKMRVNWAEISQDFDSRRMVLQKLNIRMTLFVDEAGNKKMRVTGKVIPHEEILVVENSSLGKRVFYPRIEIPFSVVLSIPA